MLLINVLVGSPEPVMTASYCRRTGPADAKCQRKGLLRRGDPCRKTAGASHTMITKVRPHQLGPLEDEEGISGLFGWLRV